MCTCTADFAASFTKCVINNYPSSDWSTSQEVIKTWCHDHCHTSRTCVGDLTVPWVRAWMMAGTRWRIPGTAWSRTQQYNVSIVMIHRFSVSVGPCMYSRYEFIAEELSLIDTYMYTCNKWSQLNQAHILIHICSIFSVLRNILKFKLLLSFF